FIARPHLNVLISTFPNITRLVVTNIPPRQLGQLQHILEQWGPQLRALKIWSNKSPNEQLPEDVQANVEELIECINSLPRLKHLEMLFGFRIFPRNPPVGAIRLPILGQLEQFSLDTCDLFSVACNSVIEYAVSNRNLQCIQIVNPIITEDSLATVLQLDQE